MTSKKNNYTPEFKKEVAQKALEQSRQNLDNLSEKYDVPVSVILMWATELEKGGEEVFKTADDEGAAAGRKEAAKTEVTIFDKEVASSVEYGVMFDNLDYKRLIFWCILGTALVVIIVQSIFEMFQYNQQATQERVSAASGEFYQSNQLKKEAKEAISNFGVVNLEEGTYKIPIDSVINSMAVEDE